MGFRETSRRFHSPGMNDRNPVIESLWMKLLVALTITIILSVLGLPQTNQQKIYETERAFEKAVAEKGFNAGFIEFLTPDAVMFFPDARKAHEVYRSRPFSPASLTWNPVWIEVSSNGLLAFSVGNGIYRPTGKDDTTEYHSHYLSIWSRQPDGLYKAVLDAGINHSPPAALPTKWKSPLGMGSEKNEEKLSAADSSVGFYQMATNAGVVKAYKEYLAEDVVLMREGLQPFWGKNAAVAYVEKAKPRISFDKRKSFIESADLAYVYDLYSIVDAAGKEIENGNFIQVWRLRNGKWQIAADMFIPIPKK